MLPPCVATSDFLIESPGACVDTTGPSAWRAHSTSTIASPVTALPYAREKESAGSTTSIVVTVPESSARRRERVRLKSVREDERTDHRCERDSVAIRDVPEPYPARNGSSRICGSTTLLPQQQIRQCRRASLLNVRPHTWNYRTEFGLFRSWPERTYDTRKAPLRIGASPCKLAVATSHDFTSPARSTATSPRRR